MCSLPIKSCLDNYGEYNLVHNISTFKNRFSENIHRVAAFLVEPAFKVILKFEENLQANAPIKAYAFTLLLIPLIFPFLLGGALKLVFSRNLFAFSKPTGPSLVSFDYLNLMSWNVILGPGFIAAANHQVVPEKRVDQIIRSLDALNPDILALQEVFDLTMESKIVSALTEKGYAIVHSILPNGIGFNSGLLVAVKLPLEIKKVQVYKFNNLISDDKLTSKGILKLTVHQDGVPFHIIATHLQASYGGLKSAQIRSTQIKALASIAAGPNTIILGDFNCSPHPLHQNDPLDEFDKVKENLNQFHTIDEQTASFIPALPDQSPLAKLDHIFIPTHISFLSSAVLDVSLSDPILSDHHPIIASIPNFI